MTNKNIFLSSKDKEWTTPKYLFDFFNKYYKFTLDPCSTKDNALCEKHFTEKEDALKQSWKNEIVFMNPPYGRYITDKWVKKAYEEAKNNGAIVVCLLPARTDTKWFWDYCSGGRIHFLQGRVKFSGSKNSATFPSMIVVFEENIIKFIHKKGGKSPGYDMFYFDHHYIKKEWEILNARKTF